MIGTYYHYLHNILLRSKLTEESRSLSCYNVFHNLLIVNKLIRK